MLTCKKIYRWFYNKWLIYKIGTLIKSHTIKDPMGLIMLHDWRKTVKNL